MIKSTDFWLRKMTRALCQIHISCSASKTKTRVAQGARADKKPSKLHYGGDCFPDPNPTKKCAMAKRTSPSPKHRKTCGFEIARQANAMRQATHPQSLRHAEASQLDEPSHPPAGTQATDLLRADQNQTLTSQAKLKPRCNAWGTQATDPLRAGQTETSMPRWGHPSHRPAARSPTPNRDEAPGEPDKPGRPYVLDSLL